MKMKKMLSLLLALVMLLGMASSVRAEETEPQIVAKGKIEMCRWTLYDDGNLLI
jgi:hypothetical protein